MSIGEIVALAVGGGYLLIAMIWVGAALRQNEYNDLWAAGGIVWPITLILVFGYWLGGKVKFA